MPAAGEPAPQREDASGQASQPNPPRHTTTNPADPDTEANAREAKSARQLLGALSVLSGIMLLATPQFMARVYGLPLRPWLARAVGARDVLVGIGLTVERSARSASLWRALADTLDVGLIAAEALRERGRARAAGLRMSAGAVLAMCAFALHRRLEPPPSTGQQK